VKRTGAFFVKRKIRMQYLTFSQGYCRRFKAFGMWHCVLREVGPDVLKDRSAFTFTVIFLNSSTLKMKILREFGNCSPEDTASNSRLLGLHKLRTFKDYCEWGDNKILAYIHFSSFVCLLHVQSILPFLMWLLGAEYKLRSFLLCNLLITAVPFSTVPSTFFLEHVDQSISI
jgi:hypothetical protein